MRLIFKTYIFVVVRISAIQAEAYRRDCWSLLILYIIIYLNNYVEYSILKLGFTINLTSKICGWLLVVVVEASARMLHVTNRRLLA